MIVVRSWIYNQDGTSNHNGQEQRRSDRIRRNRKPGKLFLWTCNSGMLTESRLRRNNNHYDPTSSKVVAERILTLTAQLFFLQVEHALLGVNIHTKIAQEIETQEAGNP